MDRDRWGMGVSPLVPLIPMIDEERKKEKGMARVYLGYLPYY